MNQGPAYAKHIYYFNDIKEITSNMKNRLTSIAGIIPLLATLFISCEKNSDFSIRTSGKMTVNDLNMISYVSQPICGGDLHADLFAGKDTKVGEVIVTLKGSLLFVEYKALDGWAFSETHLSVTNSLGEVPTNKGGNPMIGLFNYQSNHEPAVTGYVYANIAAGNGEEIYILAQAEVNPVLEWKTNLESFNGSLPETAIMKVAYPYPGSTSYFKTTITNGGILDGTFNGWCVDVNNVIYDGTDYPVNVISSYDPGFSSLGLVEKPENMDIVNWIINQNYPGKTAPDLTIYTYGDVQRAIWELVEDNPSESGLGEWSQVRVESILEEAAASGTNFEPQCGDKVALILNGADITQPFQVTIAQVYLTEFPSACQPVCGPAETAWAAGYDFGGSNWAKYFTFCMNK